MPNLPFATANYLVPLDGTTHVVVAELVLTGTAHKINWGSFSNDNFSFWPQGAYVDNSGSLADLTMVIKPINFSVTIAAGAKQMVSWPAPKSQETWLTGNGPATIFFVNYPLLSTPAEVDGKLSVVLASGATVSIGGQPISTSFSQYVPIVPADALAAQNAIPTLSQGMKWNGATWDRARSRARAVNSILTGLTTAASGSEILTLDLGLNFDQYRIASIVFQGTASTGNELLLNGSNDNVVFFRLPIASGSQGDAGDEFAGNVGAVSGFVNGFRYVNAKYINGTTAQISASLVLSVQ